MPSWLPLALTSSRILQGSSQPQMSAGSPDTGNFNPTKTEFSKPPSPEGYGEDSMNAHSQKGTHAKH